MNSRSVAMIMYEIARSQLETAQAQLEGFVALTDFLDQDEELEQMRSRAEMLCNALRSLL